MTTFMWFNCDYKTNELKNIEINTFATESREDNFHLASADEKLRTFFLDHTYMAVNKELHDNITTTPKFSYDNNISTEINNAFDLSEDKNLLWSHRGLKTIDNNWFIRIQNKSENWEEKVISDMKDSFDTLAYVENPFFKSNSMVDLYDDNREDQLKILITLII